MDLLLLPELLLMASLSLVLAFFLARLISVAAAGPTPSSSEDDRPLLHAAATVDRAAAAGAGLEEAEEGQSGGKREEKEPKEEQQQDRSSSATPPLVADSGLGDARNLHNGARWREVEIVGGETDEAEKTELSGLSSDEVAGVLEPEDHEAEQGEKNGVREIHLISAREAEEDEKPKPTRPTDQDEVRTDIQDKPKPTPTGEDGVRTEEQDKPKPTPIEDDVDGVVRTATATAIAIAVPPPPGEGPASEEVRPRAEAETEGSTVEVQQVKSVVPEQGGSSSDAANDDDDDWEGIEPSELRKLFAVAASFVAGPAGVEAISRLPADVQLQLHGLHKAATEGPCFVAQPMPLKISARAKWHAWQKLGDMNPEVAMEQYITVLSEQVPGWMVEKPNEKNMECEPSDSSEQHQSLVEAERKSEFN